MMETSGTGTVASAAVNEPALPTYSTPRASRTTSRRRSIERNERRPEPVTRSSDHATSAANTKRHVSSGKAVMPAL